jgi:hypothetical protein
MNDLPELVAIPNLILAALRNPYGFTSLRDKHSKRDACARAPLTEA